MPSERLYRLHKMSNSVNFGEVQRSSDPPWHFDPIKCGFSVLAEI